MPPDQAVLAFDTSAAHCAAALLLRGQIVVSVVEPMAKGQAERLIPMLEEVLATGGLGWHDLTAVAVGTGPGNFTGIRIAVSAARGLALGLGIPAIGVTQFDALAHGHARPLLVVEDARRGLVYVKGFGTDPDKAALMSMEEATDLGHSVPCIGTGAILISNLRPVPCKMPLADAIAQVAAARKGPQPRPAPFYLRAADASPSNDPPPVILDAMS